MTEGAAIIINVDDNEPARYAKTRILSRAGFTVHDAANGCDAIALVNRYHPDLILLDVNLPDVNGIEVCRRIKSSPAGASVLVLQISASSTTAPHATAALNSGADTYLAEPVDPDVLVATVKALLRLRKAERELSAANGRLQILNQELARSNEDLEQFAFAASHDLQEPLRTVTTFVSLLERTAGSKLTGSEREYLNYIVDGSERMRTLIDDLLRYSQAGDRTASAGCVDLGGVLTWALENLRESIAESAAVIETVPLPCVTGDEAQLRHVFQNLIGNAIKYSRSGIAPRIHLSSAQADADWVISIRDNGMGIDGRHLQVVFSPFKRLHGREIPGTGMGLAMCRKIIEAHGGKIWVESTPGEGSNFSFSLPAHPGPTDGSAD